MSLLDKAVIISLPFSLILTVYLRQGEQSEADLDPKIRRVSRLPRRAPRHPNVADLVKRYSDYIPPQGVHDLARTALAPPISESEQEYVADQPSRHIRERSKHRHHPPVKKTSTSDFEHSYAANIAPRYLTHTRRSYGQTPQISRIPGPIGSLDSQQSSRRTSPDKRTSRLNNDPTFKSGYTSPTPQGRNTAFLHGKATRGKSSGRGTAREKGSNRQASGSANKQTLRRPAGGPGGKVGNIAKHFERMSKETERANRRYAVIRGRRARPVASARAKVEVLDSVKDAIKDESESSDSSSEADDEGDDDEDGRKTTEKTTTDPSPESSSTLPQVKADGEAKDPAGLAPDTSGKMISQNTSDPMQPPLSSPSIGPSREALIALPPSPFLSHNVSLTPPPSDLDIGPSGTERSSILKALSGFWPQQLPQSRHRVELDGEDPMSDPEHIFRDSSMVVRTDEPTSIIALALK